MQTKNENTEIIVPRLIAAYEAMDLDALIKIYSKDAVIELPFNSQGKTADSDIRRIKGETELIAFLVPGLARMKSVRYDIEAVSITNGGSRAFVEARGDFITAEGKSYRNRYVFRLDLRDDRVVRQKEYFNVATVTSVFGA